MTNDHASLSRLSDHELIDEVHRCAADERQATARLIASLAELDTRRLYLGAGCSSLFTYCTQVLRLSEHAAYHRIEAARAARRFPVLLDLLIEGAITLTVVGLLAPHLTAGNHRAVLDSARHRSKREVEHIIAALRPQPAVPSTVRKLPAPRPSARRAVEHPSCLPSAGAEPPNAGAVDPPPRPPGSRPAVVTPLAPERYKLQCTLSRETYEKLRRAQDLLRHTVPNGDLSVVLDRALTLLVESLEKRKLAATDRPRPARAPAKRSRQIPAAVKRAVWARDGGQCAFVGTEGRCRETGCLEIHHVVPYAAGGQAVLENLEVRCRVHNAYEAERYFGSGQVSFVRETGPPATTWSGPSSGLQTANGLPLGVRRVNQRGRQTSLPEQLMTAISGASQAPHSPRSQTGAGPTGSTPLRPTRRDSPSSAHPCCSSRGP